MEKGESKCELGSQFELSILDRKVFAVVLHSESRRSKPVLIGTFPTKVTDVAMATGDFCSELLYYAFTPCETLGGKDWKFIGQLSPKEDFRPPPSRNVFYNPLRKKLVFQVVNRPDLSCEDVGPEAVKGLLPTIEYAGEHAIKYYSLIRLLGIKLYPEPEEYVDSLENPLELNGKLERAARERLIALGIDVSML